MTTNLITLTGKSTGKSRDKITKADINGKSIKNAAHREKEIKRLHQAKPCLSFEFEIIKSLCNNRKGSVTTIRKFRMVE